MDWKRRELGKRELGERRGGGTGGLQGRKTVAVGEHEWGARVGASKAQWRWGDSAGVRGEHEKDIWKACARLQ